MIRPSKGEKLCRQVSIETPGSTLRECVQKMDIPVPKVPPYGARLKVAYAGACYRPNKTRSMSVCSGTSENDVEVYEGTPGHVGLQDGALFPGYEVSGIIDVIGEKAINPNNLREGSRVVLFHTDGAPSDYADYIVVDDLQGLVPVPNELALSVAAMLPAGALLAMKSVYTAGEWVRPKIEGTEDVNVKASILIVGTGGLALWALRIAAHHFKKEAWAKDRVNVYVASLNDEGFDLAAEGFNVKVVQWSEDLYDRQVIDRTINTLGKVDVVINYGTNSRALLRSMFVLCEGGIVLLTEDVGQKLMTKFIYKANGLRVTISAVANGSIHQLLRLVQLVANGEIEPPPHVVFPAEDTQEVIRKLCASEVKGRAILKFLNVH